MVTGGRACRALPSDKRTMETKIMAKAKKRARRARPATDGYMAVDSLAGMRVPRPRKLTQVEIEKNEADRAFHAKADAAARGSSHLHSIVVQKRLDLVEYMRAQELTAIENLESAVRKARARAESLRAESVGLSRVLSSRMGGF